MLKQIGNNLSRMQYKFQEIQQESVALAFNDEIGKQLEKFCTIEVKNEQTDMNTIMDTRKRGKSVDYVARQKLRRAKKSLDFFNEIILIKAKSHIEPTFADKSNTQAEFPPTT